MTQKPVIAVDVDEVLTPFVKNLIEFYNSTHENRCSYEQFHSFHFADTWGCTEDESNNIVNDFLASDIFAGLKPLQHAYEVLEELKEFFDFKVVTSRQQRVEKLTKEFIGCYFPNIFSEIQLGNHYGNDGVRRSKPEMMESIGATVLIDDNVDYILECLQHGLKGILFGSYPWNTTIDESILKEHGIVRVESWKDITKKLIESHIKK